MLGCTRCSFVFILFYLPTFDVKFHKLNVIILHWYCVNVRCICFNWKVRISVSLSNKDVKCGASKSNAWLKSFPVTYDWWKHKTFQTMYKKFVTRSDKFFFFHQNRYCSWQFLVIRSSNSSGIGREIDIGTYS